MADGSFCEIFLWSNALTLNPTVSTRLPANTHDGAGGIESKCFSEKKGWMILGTTHCIARRLKLAGRQAWHGRAKAGKHHE